MQADLWTFAVDLYQRQHVAQDCLALQDRGANVCLVLCAAWLERRSIDCTPARLTGLADIAAAWSEAVVVPLRSLRQQWREDAQLDARLAQLREAVKDLELQSERILLERLESFSREWSASPSPRPWLEAVLPGPKDPAVTDGSDALHRLRAAMPDA